MQRRSKRLPEPKIVEKYGDAWPYERYYDADTATYPLGSKILFRVIVGFFWLVAKIWTRFSVEGQENLEGIPNDQGVIYIANHGCIADPVFIQCAQLRKRVVRYLYKSEYDRNDALKFIFSRIGAIPLVRGTADRKALKRAAHALERGEDVGIYPEGTRVRGRFARGPAHGGFALIAHMANAPIIPVAVEGAWRLPKPGKVRMMVGKPIYLDQFEHLDRKERMAAIEQVAMDEVFRMREELDMRNKDYPAEERKGIFTPAPKRLEE